MIDYFINGSLIFVGLLFLYVIILIFMQGIKEINKGEENE